MKLRKLRIHNFRSIKDAEVIAADMLILLGPNNHGKSNILSALEFGLSTSVKPDRDDFFSFRPENDTSLWVEMTFGQLTEQERTTFSKYVRADGTFCIRKTAHISEGGSVEVGYNGYVQEPQQWWLKSSAADRLASREQIQQEAEIAPELRPLLEGGGRVTRQRINEFQRQYIETHRGQLTFVETLEEAPLLGQKNVAGGVLPELFLVPAVRDLVEETKIKTSTVFGRLLQRAIREMTERDPRFVDLRGQLQTLVNEINVRRDGPTEAESELARLERTLADELTSWGVSVSIEVTPPEIEKIFELGTQLHLDDGLKTLAEKKGHGLQRAVLFALLRAWAKALRALPDGGPARARQASESVFFAMEEPELFLHPHAQRQLYAALSAIATAPDHQVFMCTHSTHFVDLEEYRRIAIVSKPTARDGTIIRQCTRDLFGGDDAVDRKRRFHMASWVNPDRGELFFAQKVILVEGETEKAILPFLAEKLSCYHPAVSVIDCGSKNNLPLYIAILNAFGIRYCVVHDEDPLPHPVPEDWRQEKVAAMQRTFAMNTEIAASIDARLGSVEVLSPDFEGLSGIPRSQAEKKGKAIAALDHFDGMTVEQIPVHLARTVRAAYALEVQEQGRA